MPTHESLANTAIPAPVEKPIPSRTVSTRAPKPTIQDQADTIRNSVVAESAPAAESVRLSPQLSAIARKEQALVKEKLALQQREKDLEAKLASAGKFDQLKDKFKNKDFSEAEALGLTYEDYVKYVLDKGESQDPTEQKFKTLQDEIAAIKKAKEESDSAQYEETISEYKKEIASLVALSPEFSSIKELKREDAVLQLILDSFEEDDVELTVAQAAKDIEEFLVAEAKKFTSLPKFRTETTEAVPQKTLPRPSVGKTLTNDMNAGTAKVPPKSLQHLSEAERYAEARRRVIERREKGQI